MIYIVTEAKLKNFADDMTCFFSIHIFLHLLKYFPLLWSLSKRQYYTVELFEINSQKLRLEEVQYKVCQSIKVLDFYVFSIQKINFH